MDKIKVLFVIDPDYNSRNLDITIDHIKKSYTAVSEVIICYSYDEAKRFLNGEKVDVLVEDRRHADMSLYSSVCDGVVVSITKSQDNSVSMELIKVCGSDSPVSGLTKNDLWPSVCFLVANRTVESAREKLDKLDKITNVKR